MVSLTFKFNEEKVADAGLTCDDLLVQMREHAKKYNIEEIEYGVFAKEGPDAVAVVGMIIPKIIRYNIELVDFLEEWTYDINGRPEDCIEEARYWEGRRGLQMAR
ncbi:MAG: hypothetical protein J6J16_07165 [Lachnospiraceae bacterium]|nr:hypothetical protein [Lachnospiraceae bacterium]